MRLSAENGLTAAAPRIRWSWPLVPRPPVARAFEPPASAYGAGHRGLDLEGTIGQPVRAVDQGRVTHAGFIAGRGTVTVLHASGLSSTYEPVAAAVRAGDVVVRGQRLGDLAVAGSHCAPAACLHLGARRDRRYLDPLVLLVGGRVRLLPLR
jgi:murein DD-endopeptidase MepM/ murein hydrolase activator NlpD